MSTLTEAPQDNIGWVYPPQPQTLFRTEILGVMSGTTPLISGQDYIDVSLGSVQPGTNWTILETSIVNTVDSTPLNVWPGVITNKTTTGFRLQLNGVPDSGNYVLNWSIKGAAGYLFSGPTTGTDTAASTPFTVELATGSGISGAVVVTPHDGGGGGSFSPTTVSISDASPTATFTYTPASGAATRTISVTNNRGLTDPVALSYIVTHTPVLLIHDTFTDTNGTTLPAHTMDLGSGWTRINGGSTNQITIQSNKAQSFLDNLNFYAYTTECGVADCLIEMTGVIGSLADANRTVEMIFRSSNSTNFFRLVLDGAGTITIYKYVAGTPTSIGSGSTSVTAGVPIAFSVVLSGTSIACTVGGTLVNATDSFNQTATKHGVSMYQANVNACTIDEFKVTA